MGAYSGAHWHSIRELRLELARMGVQHVRFHTAVFVPSGSRFGMFVEQILSNSLPFGAFLLMSGEPPQ